MKRLPERSRERSLQRLLGGRAHRCGPAGVIALDLAVHLLERGRQHLVQRWVEPVLRGLHSYTSQLNLSRF
jgi:hypothetical protein